MSHDRTQWGNWFSPTADSEITAPDWSGSPTVVGATFYQRLNRGIVSVDDSGYVQTDQVITGLFSFIWPSYFTTTSYGDGTSPLNIPAVTSVVFRARVATSSGLCRWRFYGKRGGTGYQISPANINTTSTSFVEEALTATTDPLTAAVWTLDTIRQTTFGFETTVMGGSFLRISSFAIGVNTTEAVGGGRARLRSLAEEPALFCIICSRPFHLSDLLRVEDSDHPHYGRYVCSSDYDELNRDRDFRDSSVSEGDIDFDL